MGLYDHGFDHRRGAQTLLQDPGRRSPVINSPMCRELVTDHSELRIED
jgi:hypothetical protein